MIRLLKKVTVFLSGSMLFLLALVRAAEFAFATWLIRSVHRHNEAMA